MAAASSNRLRASRRGTPNSTQFNHARGCSSMVEHQLPKLITRVRFPSPAPMIRSGAQVVEIKAIALDILERCELLEGEHGSIDTCYSANRVAPSDPAIDERVPFIL